MAMLKRVTGGTLEFNLPREAPRQFADAVRSLLPGASPGNA